MAAALAVASAPVSAKELIYGSWVSAKHPVMRLALPFVFKGVAKDTGGAITWKLVAGGVLVTGRATLGGLRDRLVDAGLSIPSYTPKHLPATNSIFSTLTFGSDIVAAGGASAETMLLHCPQCIKEFKKQKIIVIGSYTASPFKLMCRDKISSVADMKGKKIRSSGGGVFLVKQARGVPVAMSPAAATTALQRGALDCVLGSPSWLRSYGYQDVVKFIVDYPLGMVGPVLSMALSRKTWKSLTMDQKKAHLKYMPRVVAESVLTAYVSVEEEVMAGALRKGVTMVKVGKDFDALVAQREKAQRKVNIDNARKFGVKNPEAIANAYEKALKKWRVLSREIGRDIDKYEATLKREIYDKVDINKL